MMIALLAIVSATTDNRAVAHAQVEANYAREIAGRTQPEVDWRNRDTLETWQNQIAQFVARIDRSQATIDKIQKDLGAQNAICNYPPTLVARDNACAQVKRLGGEKEAEITQKRQLEADLRALQGRPPEKETSANAIPKAVKYESDLQSIVATIAMPESLFSLGLAIVVFFFVPLGNGAFVVALEGGRRRSAAERLPRAFQLEPELERLARMPADLQLVSAASLQMVIATLTSASARGHAASEATGAWELRFAHEVHRLRAATELKRRIARYRGITAAAKKTLIEGIDALFDRDAGKAAPASA